MTAITQAIILAGGLGTRLRSVVSEVPKPLAPVAGRPFLDWLLDDLHAHGLRRLILATGYGSDQIENRYRPGYRGMEVVISREGEPLGTGGAIKLACTQANQGPLLVLNGDTFAAWTAAPLLEAANATQAPITLGLKHMVAPDRYGTVALNGPRITAFHEKRPMPTGIINAGVYLINPAIVPWPTEARFSLERDVLEPVCASGSLAGAVLDGPFIDIGIPEAFREAQTAIPNWIQTPP